MGVGAWREDSGATGVDGDGADNGALDSGAVYVFRRGAGGFVEEAYLKASSTGAGDLFGHAVSVDPDGVVVGAISGQSRASGVDGDEGNDDLPGAGSAYLFWGDSASWRQAHYIKASNPGASDSFGSSVAIFGDNIAIGATGEASSDPGINGNQVDDSEFGAGAVYAFSRRAPTCVTYRSSTPNATGSAARLTCSGDPLSSLVLTSSPVPETLGFLLVGRDVTGPLPLGDGFVCVRGKPLPLWVVAGTSTQPANTAAFDLDYAAPYAAGLSELVYFQHWFRSGLATGSGFNTSSAVSVNFE